MCVKLGIRVSYKMGDYKKILIKGIFAARGLSAAAGFIPPSAAPKPVAVKIVDMLGEELLVFSTV